MTKNWKILAELIKPVIFWLDELSQISPIFSHCSPKFVKKKNMQNLPKNPDLSYV